MKKLILLALVAVGLLGVTSMSFAASNFLNFQVSVTVRASDINLVTDGAANNLAWGVLRPNQTVVGAAPNSWTAITPIYQVLNGGGANIDLQLYQVSAPAGWSQVAGAPGATRTGTQYRLFGAFTDYLGAPVAVSFAANDLIPVGVGNIATATHGTGAAAGVFELSNEGLTGYNGGFNVMPETYGGPDRYKGTRALKFCFDTPTPAADASVNLDIYVTAVVHP